MRDVTYEDADGRLFMVQVPDDAPPENYQYGIMVGPPDLRSLELPLSLEVKLNHELFTRRLFSQKDLRSRRGELLSALQAVYKLDARRLAIIYMEG